MNCCAPNVDNVISNQDDNKGRIDQYEDNGRIEANVEETSTDQINSLALAVLDLYVDHAAANERQVGRLAVNQSRVGSIFQSRTGSMFPSRAGSVFQARRSVFQSRAGSVYEQSSHASPVPPDTESITVPTGHIGESELHRLVKASGLTSTLRVPTVVSVVGGAGKVSLAASFAKSMVSATDRYQRVCIVAHDLSPEAWNVLGSLVDSVLDSYSGGVEAVAFDLKKTFAESQAQVIGLKTNVALQLRSGLDHYPITDWPELLVTEGGCDMCIMVCGKQGDVNRFEPRCLESVTYPTGTELVLTTVATDAVGLPFSKENVPDFEYVINLCGGDITTLTEEIVGKCMGNREGWRIPYGAMFVPVLLSTQQEQNRSLSIKIARQVLTEESLFKANRAEGVVLLSQNEGKSNSTILKYAPEAGWLPRACGREYVGLGAFDNEDKWQGNFSFVVAADPQLGFLDDKDWGGSGEGNWYEEKFAAEMLVNEVNAMNPPPRMLMIVGDLVHSMPEGTNTKYTNPEFSCRQKDDFKEVFSKLKPEIPCVVLPGNHCVGNAPTLDSISIWCKDFGDDYYSFWLGGVRCISLNTQLFSDSSLAPELQQAQEQWLEKILRDLAVTKPKHVLIFQHIPWFIYEEDEDTGYFNIPPDVRKGWLDRISSLKGDDGEPLVKAVFCGHFHHDVVSQFNENKIEHIITSAVGRQMSKEEGRVNMDLGIESEIRPGYRIVRVEEDEIQHLYVELTKNKVTDSLTKGLPLDPQAHEIMHPTPAPTIPCTVRRIMIILGPPGSGKGTHGPRVAAQLNVPFVSSGQVIREKIRMMLSDGIDSTDREAISMKEKMAEGQLLSNNFVFKAMADRINQPDCANGFVLDGFPRTMLQTKALDALLKQQGSHIWKILVMEVDSMEIIQSRILGRWVHTKSGRPYHPEFNPPLSYQGGEPTAESMKDDVTGEPLQKCEEDTVASLNQQVHSHFAKIVPIVKHYESLQRQDGEYPDIITNIDATSDLDTVWGLIRNQIY